MNMAFSIVAGGCVGLIIAAALIVVSWVESEIRGDV